MKKHNTISLTVKWLDVSVNPALLKIAMGLSVEMLFHDYTTLFLEAKKA